MPGVAVLIGPRTLPQGVGAFAAVPAMAQGALDEVTAAAGKEGAVTFYTSIDGRVVEKLNAALETRSPRPGSRVERSGAERIPQRLMLRRSPGTRKRSNSAMPRCSESEAWIERMI